MLFCSVVQTMWRFKFVGVSSEFFKKGKKGSKSVKIPNFHVKKARGRD
jgi:hypothetical protein